MKMSAIEVGKTYTNRGKGRTRRTVINMGPKFQPLGDSDRPDDHWGVEFTQGNETEPRRLWIDSFASWAGRVVDPE